MDPELKQHLADVGIVFESLSRTLQSDKTLCDEELIKIRSTLDACSNVIQNVRYVHFSRN